MRSHTITSSLFHNWYVIISKNLSFHTTHSSTTCVHNIAVCGGDTRSTNILLTVVVGSDVANYCYGTIDLYLWIYSVIFCSSIMHAAQTHNNVRSPFCRNICRSCYICGGSLQKDVVQQFPVMPSAISQWVSSSTAVNYRQWTSLSGGTVRVYTHTHTTSGWMTSVSTVQIPHQTVSVAQFSCHLSLKSCSSWKKLLQVYRTMYGGKVVLIIWWCLLPGPSCCSGCDEWCDVWSQWGMEHGPMHTLQLQGNAEWNMYYYYVISDGSNHLQHPTLLASLAIYLIHNKTTSFTV